MATIIPTIGSCGNKITAGEKRLARILESNLSGNCTCWYDIPTGEKQTHPDFIIMDPQRGLLFIEVKDWYVSKIKSANKTQVIYETSNGDIPLTNPIEQVRQYSYGAINYLKRDPQLIQNDDRYKGQFCAPYGHGVYFSNITRKQLDKYFLDSDIFPSDIVICKDEITEFMSSEEISLRLFSLIKHSFPKGISKHQIDRIRWHLYPEIRITHALDKIENTPAKTYVLKTPNILKIMDTQQELLARSLGEGHRVIHGVAGSGKTLILLYRCLHLAKDNELNKPILVVCYNIMLAQKLKSIINNHRLNVPIEITNFHAWCYKQAKIKNILPNSKYNFVENLEQAVITGFQNRTIEAEQYSAVLIDEGHDFKQDWLKILSGMVDSKTNYLLFLYDDAQSIYQKKSSLDFTLSSVDIKAQGRTTILDINYRNTQQILHFATSITFDYLNAHIDDKFKYHKPDAGGLTGKYPIMFSFDTHQQEIIHTIKWLNQQHQKGVSWNDMAILCPSTAHLSNELVNELIQSQIPYYFISNQDDKKNYSPQRNFVSIIPLPSSKGLEFHSVAVIDSSNIMGNEDDLSDELKRLYVGFTRATNNLLVTLYQKNILSRHLISTYNRLSEDV
ncbi:3'-5' exonuclease [Klebsiella aerogenes]|uniref:3'-5' exonuclease n=1 Tax=Klebsiella TaxID=570 RepID=UPI001BD28E06|nr:3'-5' exonuclease [Klebsiella aerogenes]EKV8809743.1 AAA family ATPase [Klebsiella aerogenes]EKV8811006.1 AAA family ATPase [Klebsiella aerogenes]EKW8940091.1 AAA family ATPase [Klebsiella aerogenes]EKW8940906.1 AAA family ATPase [Klebsiella aerogenes]ELJ2009137.1 AAA family ATPase [Klebsiella aerogenes]